MLQQQFDNTDFGDRLRTSFAEVFGQIVPALFGAAIIIFAGYLCAKAIERGVEKGLRKIRLNSMLKRGGVIQAVERSGTQVNPSRVLANMVFWLIMFAVILLASNALGLDSLANVVGLMVSAIPSVIAAVVIILMGIILGGFVEGVIAASTGSLHGGKSLARVGRGGVVLLSVFMALQELGIATEIVSTAFAILFGAIALAMALSFGLGNRELAGEVTREWYDRFRRERAEAMARDAADEAQLDAELEADRRSEDIIEPNPSPPENMPGSTFPG